MTRHSYTDTELKEAVANSRSVRQVLHRLGLRPAGGNYSTMRRRFNELGIDTSHFQGQAWNKGKRYSFKSVESYLCKDSSIQPHKLRLRLIRKGLKEAKCESCGNSEWCGVSMPLELDHKNGVRTDNRLENLRILCPNCHALTTTYRGKNRGRYAKA